MSKERYSKQREAILAAVKNTKSHPTAEWVFHTVRTELPNISLGTVYRNLNYLVEKGKIREVVLDDSITRYDGNLQEHQHCICDNCGTIIDIHVDTQEVLNQLEDHIRDFDIYTHKIELHGLCKNCRD